MKVGVQIGLFDFAATGRRVELEPPRARRCDPDTSHASAARVGEFDAIHFDKIKKALATPGTIYDLADRTGLDAVQIARRLPEMRGVRRNGKKKPSPRGRPCGEWELVDVD